MRRSAIIRVAPLLRAVPLAMRIVGCFYRTPGLPEVHLDIVGLEQSGLVLRA